MSFISNLFTKLKQQNTIDFIAIGQDTHNGNDDESQLARKLFASEINAVNAPIWQIAADSTEALVNAVIVKANAERLPSSSIMLIIRHDQTIPAPNTIETLIRWLNTGYECLYACDAKHCAGADYYTLHGLARFAKSREDCLQDGFKENNEPLILISRLSALLNHQWKNAPFVNTAWVHDFSHYRQGSREEILALIPSKCNALLDVGGGAGGFLNAVTAHLPHCRTALVEMDAFACNLASQTVDRVWQGDFCTLQIDEQFDCISFLDILEHTPNPKELLDKAQQLLAPDGVVIASIPNVGHWSVVADLLEGHWDYAPAGIHCITHLRFFTRQSIETLFAEAGFSIDEWHSASSNPPSWFEQISTISPLSLDKESLSAVAWHIIASRKTLFNKEATK